MLFTNLCISYFGAVTIILCFVGCATNPNVVTDAPPDAIVQLVKSLGQNPEPSSVNYENNLDVIQKLAIHPQKAVRVLVGELKPVPFTKLNEPQNDVIENIMAYHVIWCLRALYYMTGNNFLAKSSYKLTSSEIDDNRSGLVYDQKSGKWCFFTEWMSRGTTYFAPVDAQVEIIDKWRTWIREKAKAYKYNKEAELNDWYFGGVGNNNYGEQGPSHLTSTNLLIPPPQSLVPWN